MHNYIELNKVFKKNNNNLNNINNNFHKDILKYFILIKELKKFRIDMANLK